MNLENNGIDINVGGHQTKCKAFLICGTADLPAKSLALNINQFNGAFRCHKCLQCGETFRTENRGNIHVFPFNQDLPLGNPRRTHAQSVHDAIDAVRKKQTVHGVKGPSFLMALSSYDFVQRTGIDYMHAVFLGVTRLFLRLWFLPAHGREKYSLSHFIDVAHISNIGKHQS